MKQNALLRQPDKETEFDHFGGAGVHRGQAIECLVQRQKLVVR